MKKVVDTRGMICPAPLIATKKAIRESATGTQIEVITDNDTACSNLTSYLFELGIDASQTDSEGVTRIGFEVGVPTAGSSAATRGGAGSVGVGSTATTPITLNEAETCALPCGVQNYVVVVKSNCMGTGDDTLGEMLLRAFINSLCEADRLPRYVVLYNGGVQIAIEGSDTAASLQKLVQEGVGVIVCGTCVDYFGIKERLAVGTISNMYKITAILTEADFVVYP